MRYDEMWAFSEHMFEQTSIAYVVSLRSHPRAARRGRSGRASIEWGKEVGCCFGFPEGGLGQQPECSARTPLRRRGTALSLEGPRVSLSV